jgi:hypothetical protein
LTFADLALTLVIPADALPFSEVVDATGVAPDTEPPLPDGFQLGAHVFQITATDPNSAQSVSEVAAPVTLNYQLSPAELDASGISRDRLASWDGSAWVGLDCAVDASAGTLSCTSSHLSIFALLEPPVPDESLDAEIANGHFFKQANGFAGAGNLGFAVIDDGDAMFWSEFQRLGGVDQVGYPISQRFMHGGFLTQAFQKLVLQWRPELGQAVPVNVFDDLSTGAHDAWLDQQRQVPPMPTTPADAGQPLDQVVAQRRALLDPYPGLASFYDVSPDALERFGVPVAVKDYDAMVAVRLQRAVLQLWTRDSPTAPAGTVLVGNGGDLGKVVGLWPEDALAPTPGP